MNEAFRPTGWDRAGLAVLVVVCAWGARLVTVGGLHVTGDRALGMAAVVALGVLVVRRGLHWTPVHSVLAAFTAVQILTSMFAVRTWPSGLKFVTVYVLGFACFALAAEWAREGDGLRRSARLWILVGALLGLAGTAVTIFANARQILVWGAGRTPDVSVRGGTRFAVYAARATFTEWNLYSSFLLVAFALALWAWKPDQNGRIRSGLLPVIGVTLGLVFGLTRAAWIAMAGIALFWLWSRRPTVRQVGILALVVAIGMSVQATAIGASPLQFRVAKPIQMRSDPNLAVRFSINAATIQSWLHRPLFGNGAGSVNTLHVMRSPQKTWNGNLLLFLLHDSGLVGIAAFAAVIVVVVVKARDALKRRAHDQTLMRWPDGDVLLPLLAAGVALFWAYQFTHAFWLMYPYVYLGLLTASIEQRPSPR